jgi:hypothetical protein
MLVLRCENDICKYEAATIAFARTGERAALYRDLLALGLTGQDVRWHVDNVGERQVCISP